MNLEQLVEEQEYLNNLVVQELNRLTLINIRLMGEDDLLPVYESTAKENLSQKGVLGLIESQQDHFQKTLNYLRQEVDRLSSVFV